MPDRIETKFGPVDIPSVEELRAIGRERLMTYFLGTSVTPPGDLDAMAQAAHDLLALETVEEPFDWADALENAKWIPMEDVLKGLGIDSDEGSPDESAA